MIFFLEIVNGFRIMNVKTGDFLTGVNGMKISKTTSDDWITISINLGYSRIGVATDRFIESKDDILKVDKKGTDFKIIRDHTGYMRIVSKKKCWEQDGLEIKLRKCKKSRIQLWQFINDCSNCLAKDNMSGIEEVFI